MQGFVEGQEKLSFAAFVRGQTKHAVSISIMPGQMERLPRLNDAELRFATGVYARALCGALFRNRKG